MQQLSFSLFVHHPVQALSFLSLMMALCSLWIKKNMWFWGCFSFISLVLAFESHILAPITIIPLSFFTILLISLKLPVQGFARFLLSSTTFLIGSSIFLGLLPGFFNPFHFDLLPSLVYGKMVITVLLLGCFIPLLNKEKIRWPLFWKILLLSFLGLIFLTVTSFYLLRPAWNIQTSLFFFPWAIIILFCVVIPEEALLRGFLQKELTLWIGNRVGAQICAILITAITQLFFHISWTNNLSLMFPIFLSGVVYGILYQITKHIETSILCHFFTLCTQFLFFYLT